MIRHNPLVTTAFLIGIVQVGATQDRPAVAVLPFENAGSYGKDKEEFEALKRGLAATLSSELSSGGAVRPIDRERIQKMLEERGATASERLDLATAARIGKALGARYTVAGTFVDLYGDFRIDAQIIDVESGEVVKVVRNDPRLADRAQMFRMVQSVGDRILEAMKIPTPGKPAGRNIPTEAIISYSRALLYLDRGDKQRATEFATKAAQSFPGYAEAETLLKSLR